MFVMENLLKLPLLVYVLVINLAALCCTISNKLLILTEVGDQHMEPYLIIGKTHAMNALHLTDFGAKYKFLRSIFKIVVALLHFFYMVENDSQATT